MAGGVITAAIWGAIIQAIPLTIAAGAGLIGLQNWREQLKTRRQVEVAEACLLSGENAIGAARATRTRHFAVAEDETRNRQAISAAIQKSTGHRFDEAWRAYRDFAGKYRLADLYLALGEPNLAQE